MNTGGELRAYGAGGKDDIGQNNQTGHRRQDSQEKSKVHRDLLHRVRLHDVDLAIALRGEHLLVIGAIANQNPRAD